MRYWTLFLVCLPWCCKAQKLLIQAPSAGIKLNAFQGRLKLQTSKGSLLVKKLNIPWTPQGNWKKVYQKGALVLYKGKGLLEYSGKAEIFQFLGSDIQLTVIGTAKITLFSDPDVLFFKNLYRYDDKGPMQQWGHTPISTLWLPQKRS